MRMYLVQLRIAQLVHFCTNNQKQADCLSSSP